MVLKSNFQRGSGLQAKKPSVGGVWIFLEQHIVYTQAKELYFYMYYNSSYCVISQFLILSQDGMLVRYSDLSPALNSFVRQWGYNRKTDIIQREALSEKQTHSDH